MSPAAAWWRAVVGLLAADDPDGMRSSDRVDDPTGVDKTEGSDLRRNELGESVFVDRDAIRGDRRSPPSRVERVARLTDDRDAGNDSRDSLHHRHGIWRFPGQRR